MNDLTRTSLAITIPKSTSWEEYEKELKKAENGEVMNFKVTNFPKKVSKGDRCYVVHDGMLKGWMEITGFSEKTFTCTTTGKRMSGKFIERSGKFHKPKKEIPYKGFRGFKYLTFRGFPIGENIIEVREDASYEELSNIFWSVDREYWSPRNENSDKFSSSLWAKFLSEFENRNSKHE